MLLVETVTDRKFRRIDPEDREVEQAVGDVDGPDGKTKDQIGLPWEVAEPPSLRKDIKPCDGDKRGIKAQQVGEQPQRLSGLGRHSGRRFASDGLNASAHSPQGGNQAMISSATSTVALAPSRCLTIASEKSRAVPAPREVMI